MTYSAGSIVVLKSGGPAMTVVAADEENIECVWMTDVGELSRESIPAIALEAVETEEEEDEESGDEDEDFDDEDEDEEEEEEEEDGDDVRAEDDDDDDSKKKKKKKKELAD